MNDEQAESVWLAGQQLALIVRDEGPHASAVAAREVIRLAGDDPVAALILTAASVNPYGALDPFWQDGPAGLKTCTGCHEAKTVSEFKTDRSRADGLSYRCRACLAHGLKRRVA